MAVHLAGSEYATLCATADSDAQISFDGLTADCLDCCAIAGIEPYAPRYARYNEYGGIVYTRTRAEIEGNSAETNWWTYDYDSETDTFTVWQLGNRENTVHDLRRIN